MPVNKIDYSKTIIYRIVCKDTNITDCYIGKTTDLRSRKKQHKITCNNKNDKHYNIYVYQFIRNNMGWDNWDIIEVEKYNAIDSNDSLKRERYWIEFYKASLNIVKPTRTDKEYYEDNKKKILNYQRVYYDKNRELILKNTNQYRKDNIELINEKKKEYRNREEVKEYLKEKAKNYYQDNKKMIREKRKEYDKEYYEKNKELIRERLKETVTCDCGFIGNKYHLPRHQKSQKHLNIINNI